MPRRGHTYRSYAPRCLGALALCAFFLTLAGSFSVVSRTLAAAASHPSPPYDSRSIPAAAPSPSLSAPPTASAPPATLPPVPSPTATPAPPAYDYAVPVPASQAVSLDWFSDAAFLGDSRTEGLLLYTKVRPAGRLAYRGMNLQTARSKAFLPSHGKRLSALEALQEQRFSKLYLGLGLNDLGWRSPEGFYLQYAQLIDQIRQLQPQAQIYLQTLLPVTSRKSNEGIFTNAKITAYNQKLQLLAQQKELFLLDIWSQFADASGTLPAQESSDGIHLFPNAYEKWLSYLQTHTVAFDSGKEGAP